MLDYYWKQMCLVYELLLKQYVQSLVVDIK